MTFVMTAVKPRDRMIESAALLIREFGVAGTGMREIAEHAQAPRGSLQHYFPSGKDQVVAEALGWVADQVTAPLYKAAGAEPAPSARIVVAKLFERWRRILSSTDFLAGCPLVATITDAADNDALRAAAAQGFDRWRDALAAALHHGGVSRRRSERVAVLAISALEGAIVMARAHRDLAALDIVAREMDLLVAEVIR
jgi:AcrR family transcriptional regulator